MQIHRLGERPSKRANEAWFTGAVFQEPIIEAPEPARVRALRVACSPCARTNWHTHPLGQTLSISEGVGLVGLRGEAAQVVKAGDTVWIPPDVEHWHGAAPTSWMVHIAIQEAAETGVATWLEPVSEEDYAL